MVEGDSEKSAFPLLFRLATGRRMQEIGVVPFDSGGNGSVFTLTLDTLAHACSRSLGIDQPATTSVFWQAVSNQRPSSCLDITYSGAPSLSSPGDR